MTAIVFGLGLTLLSYQIVERCKNEQLDQKVLLSQQQVKNYDQYLKFVSSGTVEEIAEIKEVINIYKTDGVKIPPVWLMPMACTGEQQRLIAQKVAKICMDNGWLYSHRIQNDLWDNAIGT